MSLDKSTTSLDNPDMSLENVKDWLDQVAASDSQNESQGHGRPSREDVLAELLTSLVPPTTAKRTLEPDSLETDPSKRQRIEARDPDVPLNTVEYVPSLGGNLSASPAPTSLTRETLSPSPSRIQLLLQIATPRVRFLQEWDDAADSAAKDLRNLLCHYPTKWEPDIFDLQDLVEAAHKCADQQRSEISWMTEVARPALHAAIDDLELESWGVGEETVCAEYQPVYPDGGRQSPMIQWVVGFPKDRWESLYNTVAAKFGANEINHVNHPHTGTRLLGCACAIRADPEDWLEAEVQLGVWVAGWFSWAFEQRSGDLDPPPMVGIVLVGDLWQFYIVYGVSETSEDGERGPLSEVHVWGPLPELTGRPTNDKRGCYSLLLTLRRVMEYITGWYIDELLESVFA